MHYKARNEPLAPVLENQQCLTYLPMIYFLFKDGRVIYIGQSGNLVHRLKAHRHKDYDTVGYFPMFLVEGLSQNIMELESLLIRNYLPLRNRVIKCGLFNPHYQNS